MSDDVFTPFSYDESLVSDLKLSREEGSIPPDKRVQFLIINNTVVRAKVVLSDPPY
jgi:hypothetical protein